MLKVHLFSLFFCGVLISACTENVETDSTDENFTGGATLITCDRAKQSETDISLSLRCRFEDETDIDFLLASKLTYECATKMQLVRGADGKANLAITNWKKPGFVYGGNEPERAKLRVDIAKKITKKGNETDFAFDGDFVNEKTRGIYLMPSPKDPNQTNPSIFDVGYYNPEGYGNRTEGVMRGCTSEKVAQVPCTLGDFSVAKGKKVTLSDGCSVCSCSNAGTLSCTSTGCDSRKNACSYDGKVFKTGEKIEVLAGPSNKLSPCTCQASGAWACPN